MEDKILIIRVKAHPQMTEEEQYLHAILEAEIAMNLNSKLRFHLLTYYDEKELRKKSPELF